MEYLTVRKLFLFSQEDRRTLHTWIWISSRPVKNYNYKFQDNCIWIRGLFQGNPGPRLFPALSRPGNLIFEFQDFPESVWTLLIILSTFPLWLKLEVTTTREYGQPKNILNRYVKNSHVTVGCDWGGVVWTPEPSQTAMPLTITQQYDDWCTGRLCTVLSLLYQA